MFYKDKKSEKRRFENVAPCDCYFVTHRWYWLPTEMRAKCNTSVTRHIPTLEAYDGVEFFDYLCKPALIKNFTMLSADGSFTALSNTFVRERRGHWHPDGSRWQTMTVYHLMMSASNHVTHYDRRHSSIATDRRRSIPPAAAAEDSRGL